MDTSSPLRGRECSLSLAVQGRRARKTTSVAFEMTTEALRTQLDALRVEMQRLEAENAKLRDSNPEDAMQLDTEAEVAQIQEESKRARGEAEHMRALYKQSLRDLQERGEEAQSWQQRTEPGGEGRVAGCLCVIGGPL